MKTIISASRRTDIPAWYTEWFIERLREGYVYVKNPYTGKPLRVPLTPDTVHSIVFWSKNFSPLISRIHEVERTTRNLFFHFTITGIPGDMEQNIPSHRECIDDLIYLVKRYSPRCVVWRFDPLVVTDRLSREFYIDMFSECAERLRGYIRVCYTSLVEPYRKITRNIRRYSDHTLIEMDIEEKRGLIHVLADVAKRYDIRLLVCCNDYLLYEGVSKGSCINGRYLSWVFNDHSTTLESSPTRKGCACTKSIDIGSYDTCPGGCLYCYANTDKHRALKAYRTHNPEWNGLGFNLTRGKTFL